VPVILWSDVLIWLLLVAAIALFVACCRARKDAARGLAAGGPQPGGRWPRRRCWSPSSWSACSIRCIIRPRLENPASAGQGRPERAAGARPLRRGSAVAARCILTPLRTRNEKTYSEPLATRAVRQGSDRGARCRRQLRQSARLSAPEAWRRASRRRRGTARCRCRPCASCAACRRLALAAWWALAARRRPLWRAGRSCPHRGGLATDLAPATRVILPGMRCSRRLPALLLLASPLALLAAVPRLRHRQGRPGRALPDAQEHPHRPGDRHPDHAGDAAAGVLLGILAGYSAAGSTT
jgi:hypothetical protein